MSRLNDLLARDRAELDNLPDDHPFKQALLRQQEQHEAIAPIANALMEIGGNEESEDNNETKDD